MVKVNVNQKLGEVSELDLREWMVELILDLHKDMGIKPDKDDCRYIVFRVMQELKRQARFKELSIGFIGTGINGIITGIYDVKKISAQTIITTLIKEAEASLTIRTNMNYERKKNNFEKMMAAAAVYGSPEQKAHIWAIKLMCDKLSKRGVRYQQRKLNGFWGRAALSEGIEINKLVDCSDEEFVKLTDRLFPRVTQYQAEYEERSKTYYKQ